MRALRTILSIRFFLLISIVFILTGSVILWLHDKSMIHMAINSVHTVFFDFLFRWITYLGDGIVSVLVSITVAIVLHRQYGWSVFWLGAFTLIFAGIFAQILKQLVYPGAERPLVFLENEHLYLVPGVEVHSSNSFPSGHTTSAFAFFAFLSFTLAQGKIWLQLFFALLAGAVGYSRMYLSQHFLEDVVTGAVLGLMSFMLAFLLVRQLKFGQHICRSSG